MCWRRCRLLPLADGRRLKFDPDPVPADLPNLRVGYTLAMQLNPAGRLVFAAALARHVPALLWSGSRVFLPHRCTPIANPTGAVERIAA